MGLAEEVREKGGFVSMRKLEDGSETPYELNATYYSALSDPKDEELGELRFLCSQSVAMAMRGIPAVLLSFTLRKSERFERRKANRPESNHQPEKMEIRGTGKNTR